MKLISKTLVVTLSSIFMFTLVSADIFARGHHKRDRHSKGKPFKNLYEMVQSNNDAIAELRASSEEVKAIIEALKTDLTTLETGVDTNTQGIESLEGDAALLKKEIEDAFTRLEGLKEKQAVLEEVSANNNAEIEGIKLQIYMLNQEVTAKTDQLALVLSELETEVKARLDNVEGATANNETRIQILESEAANLRRELESTSAAVTTLNSEMVSVQQTLSQSTLDTNQVKSDIVDLKAEITIKSEELAAAINTLKAQLDAQNAEFETYKAEATIKEDGVKAQIQELQAEIDLIKQDVQNSGNAITAEDLAAINFQLVTLVTDVQELQTSLAELKTQFNNHQHSFIYYDTWYRDGLKFTNYRVVNITSTTW